MAKATIYTVQDIEGPLNAYATKAEAMKAAAPNDRVLKITTEDMPLRQLIVAIINHGAWQADVEVVQTGWDGAPEDDIFDLDEEGVDDIFDLEDEEGTDEIFAL